MERVSLMGINRGVFHGVGQRIVAAPTFQGTVTIQPPANLPGVTAMIVQSSPGQTAITELINVYLKTGALAFQIPIAGGPLVNNAEFVAGSFFEGGIFAPSFFGLDGSTNPPSMLASASNRVYISNVPMNSANFGPSGAHGNIHGNVGDLYFDQINTHIIQRCSTAGNPGTWTTI